MLPSHLDEVRVILWGPTRRLRLQIEVPKTAARNWVACVSAGHSEIARLVGARD